MRISLTAIIKKVTLITDRLAGACFFSVMALVVSNIIMRNIFKRPILGTMEIVGLLCVTGLGLALSNCEMINFNVGMDVVMEKLSDKTRKTIKLGTYSVALCFWSIVVWRMYIYASATYMNKRVTPTTSIPVYPFVFMLGFNLLCLCAVLAYKLVRAARDVYALSRGSSDAGKEIS